VHCNTCEGAGAALRTYLRAFRGVRKRHLHLYVETYEPMVDARCVTLELIQRMCGHDLSIRSRHMSQMDKMIECPCGYTIRAENEATLVSEVQEQACPKRCMRCN
jgi:hypothetical protein